MHQSPAPFEGDSRFFEFIFFQFSQHSIKRIHKRMADLRREILELAEVDGSLPVDQKQDCGVLMALRPWMFSPLHSLNKK
jgi:hypothetical protein